MYRVYEYFITILKVWIFYYYVKSKDVVPDILLTQEKIVQSNSEKNILIEVKETKKHSNKT